MFSYPLVHTNSIRSLFSYVPINCDQFPFKEKHLGPYQKPLMKNRNTRSCLFFKIRNIDIKQSKFSVCGQKQKSRIYICLDLHYTLNQFHDKTLLQSMSLLPTVNVYRFVSIYLTCMLVQICPIWKKKSCSYLFEIKIQIHCFCFSFLISDEKIKLAKYAVACFPKAWYCHHHVSQWGGCL